MRCGVSRGVSGREIGPENKVPGGGFQFPAAWKTSCTHCDLSVTTSGDTGEALALKVFGCRSLQRGSVASRRQITSVIWSSD